ncbi:MAG: GspH/FimT family pseudopilin [Gammaproteobacteria bacterium]|nr:GspH/FimT family pseudopilin [Gammaproteobacteria bacterium]
MRQTSYTDYPANPVNSVQTGLPFVCQNKPFVGLTSTLTKPLIGRNAPLVEINRFHGFTLIELIVVLAIAAIIFSFAIPNFRELMLNSRLRSDSDELTTGLLVARSEAIKQKKDIYVCHRTSISTTRGCTAPSSTEGWFNGFMVWADEDSDGAYTDGTDTVIRDVQSFKPNIRILSTKGANKIQQAVYTSRGTAYAYVSTTPDYSPSTTLSFLVCDKARTNELGRRIDISRTGRVKVSKQTCTTI